MANQEKVLIVEDQFLEANNLKIILEKAGHEVWGVAKSVDQAMNRPPFRTSLVSNSRTWHSASSRTSTVIHGR